MINIGAKPLAITRPRAGALPPAPAPTPAGWTYTDAGSLYSWLDASDANARVSTDGLVSDLHDKSGNGRHLRQTEVASQPAVGEITFASRDTFSFRNSHLPALAPYTNFGSEYAIIFAISVGDQSIEGAINEAVFELVDGTGFQRVRNGASDAFTYSVHTRTPVGSGQAFSSVSAPAPIDQVRVYTLVNTGDTVVRSISGAVVSSDRHFIDLSGWSPVFTLGDLDNSFQTAMPHQFCESVCLRAGTLDERQRAEALMAFRWGAPLDAAHPYAGRQAEFSL